MTGNAFLQLSDLWDRPFGPLLIRRRGAVLVGTQPPSPKFLLTYTVSRAESIPDYMQDLHVWNSRLSDRDSARTNTRTLLEEVPG